MSRILINDAFERLARAETAFLGTQFLAPVVRGRGVNVRIAGVRCTLLVTPAEFQGWGVFRPVSHNVAMLVRAASGGERRDYLSLFPAVRLVVCARSGTRATAVPANASDQRFHIRGPAEVQLVVEADLFDTLLVRFDGVQFWFEELESRADPAIAAYLRRALTELTDPADLRQPGLSEGQRLAYEVAHGRRAAAILADEQYRGELRLKAALAHAGATLRDFTDAGDSYRVSYTVDGRRHTSVVRKGDLMVQSAGICLSGEDRLFDLNSLVGVLREGAGGGRIFAW